MKKLIGLILIVLTFSVATIPAYAANTSESAAGIVTPNFIGITFLNANLSIDSQGYATSTGFVRPSSSSYTSYLTVSLQAYTSDGWTTLKSWSGSSAGLTGVSTSGSIYVGSGSYRACATASIYSSSGALVDSSETYSEVKGY